MCRNIPVYTEKFEIHRFTEDRKKLTLNIQSNAKWKRKKSDQEEKLYILANNRYGEMVINEIDPKGKTNLKYYLEYKQWMSPEVNIIVFYYSYYGEFIYDAINFKNYDIIKNRVSSQI